MLKIIMMDDEEEAGHKKADHIYELRRREKLQAERQRLLTGEVEGYKGKKVRFRRINIASQDFQGKSVGQEYKGIKFLDLPPIKLQKRGRIVLKPRRHKVGSIMLAYVPDDNERIRVAFAYCSPAEAYMDKRTGEFHDGFDYLKAEVKAGGRLFKEHRGTYHIVDNNPGTSMLAKVKAYAIAEAIRRNIDWMKPVTPDMLR